MRPRNKKQSKNQISNVRVIDNDADTDSLRIDRMISHIHSTGAQTRLLATSSLNLAQGAAEADVVYNYNTFVNSDEFAALALQFDEFRIRGARFDCYNTNNNANMLAAASTYHNTSVGGPSSTYTFVAVVDGEDSAIIPINGVRTSFYWMAKSTNELGYQPTSVTGSTVIDYGGLRLAIPPGTGTLGSIQTICKWVVDFRGRR